MRSVAFALTLLAQASLGAQDTSAARDIPRAMRTVFGIQLNRDNASVLAVKLGRTEEWESGDGHDRYVNWCYRSGTGPDGVTLHVLSDDSDMRTADHDVNVLRLLRGAEPAIDGHACAVIEDRHRTTGLGALRLGSSPREVERALGAPTRRTADSLVYEFHSEQALDPKSPYFAEWNTPEQRARCFDGRSPFTNVGGLVAVVFSAGLAVEIRVERYDNAMC